MDISYLQDRQVKMQGYRIACNSVQAGEASEGKRINQPGADSGSFSSTQSKRGNTLLLSFTGKCVIFFNKLRKGREKQCQQARSMYTCRDTENVRLGRICLHQRCV